MSKQNEISIWFTCLMVAISSIGNVRKVEANSLDSPVFHLHRSTNWTEFPSRLWARSVPSKQGGSTYVVAEGCLDRNTLVFLWRSVADIGILTYTSPTILVRFHFVIVFEVRVCFQVVVALLWHPGEYAFALMFNLKTITLVARGSSCWGLYVT